MLQRELLQRELLQRVILQRGILQRETFATRRDHYIKRLRQDALTTEKATHGLLTAKRGLLADCEPPNRGLFTGYHRQEMVVTETRGLLKIMKKRWPKRVDC